MPSLILRYKTVASPFLGMGEKWDLVGICLGIAWDLETSSFNVNSTNLYVFAILLAFFLKIFGALIEIVYLCARQIEDRAPAFRADTHFCFRASLSLRPTN